MGKEFTFEENDLYRALGRVIESLDAWQNPMIDPEARIMAIRHIKEAQLWTMVILGSKT